MSKDISRREFLKGAGAIAAGMASMGVLGACAAQTSETAAATAAATEAATTAAETEAAAESVETAAAEVAERVTEELPIPEVDPPEKTEYSCDVLVIGGGFAGLSAAAAASDAGQSVVMIDKGRPGYSGLAPWPSSHRWLDEDIDDAQAFRDCINRGGEYIGNMDWYEVWIKESKQTYERLMDWGILTQYPKASDAGDYYDKKDYAGYREAFAQYDRRTKWVEVLESKGIEYAEYTMITNVIVEDGRVCGAVGFHVPSGAIVTCHAKAVVMCMGGGCYKPTGFPVGGVTFDGEYIAYNLGLPIAGKEFDDFHMTCSWAPGNAFQNNNWTYLENIWLCGGDVTAETAESYATSKGKVMVLDRVTKAVTGLSATDGTAVEDMSEQSITRKGGSVVAETNPNEVRTGKDNDTMFKGDVYGAAVGFGGHLSCGVLCGLDDLVGYSGIPGLYVAGDGINASAPSGAAYPCGVGFTSNFVSIQGNRAGAAAAGYAAGVDLVKVSADAIAEETAQIQAPLAVDSGFDPNWARDQLHAIMAPYWIHVAKNKDTLTGALAQVEYLRDHVAPKLMARSSHDVRLCLEMKHKILSAEMKLRAGLAREESRGLHYRSDFPYRDDKNFLCYITVQKDENGNMTTAKVPVKDAWKGDVNADYEERYKFYFPGEREALGLPPEETSGGWAG